MKAFIENNNVLGAIFDMDGLMFDTERLYTETWPIAAKEFGYIVTLEQINGAIGLTAEAGERHFRSFFGEAFPFYEIRKARLILSDKIIEEKGVPIKPGLFELFDFLEKKGIKKAVATSCEKARALRYLKSAGLENRVEAFISGDDVTKSKPDPEIFLKAAAAIGIKPSACAVFEDSYNGIKAGAAAGMLPVMVPDYLQPTEEIRSLCALVAPSLWY